IGNQLHREPRALAHFRIIARCAPVGGFGQLCVGVAQHLPGESLRRLRPPDALPIHGPRDARRRLVRPPPPPPPPPPPAPPASTVSPPAAAPTARAAPTPTTTRP